jgi:hypothetical protein
MNFPHFLRIEREQRVRLRQDSGATAAGSRHIVVHTCDPKLSLELEPDVTAPDKIVRGVIKRVCVPNSWAGDYGRYAKVITVAQEFFRASFAGPARGDSSNGRR